MHSFHSAVLNEFIWMLIMPAKLHECLSNNRKCSSEMVANVLAEEPCSNEWAFSRCLAIVSIGHRSSCILKQSLSRMGKERSQTMGMQVAISPVLPERAQLPPWALCWASLCKPCSYQSPQHEEKIDFEASSPSPPSVHAIDAKSSNSGDFASIISFPETKGNQITEVQEKCCSTTPWTRKMVKKPAPEKGGAWNATTP